MINYAAEYAKRPCADTAYDFMPHPVQGAERKPVRWCLVHDRPLDSCRIPDLESEIATLKERVANLQSPTRDP
jgi:hypothetical protein